VFQALGGLPAGGLVLQHLIEVGPGFLAGAATYYVINMLAVCGIIALTSHGSVWEAWRENYGYRTEMVSTAALVAMAPIAGLTYQMLGGWGLAVFLIPVALIRDAGVRFIALRRAQGQLVASERLAAKNELAAEVGHEINNYLTVVQGQLQLILRHGMGTDEAEKRIRVALEQVGNITKLSQGLMDFSQRDTTLAPVRINELVETTVGFLQPQKRFDDVRIALDLDPRIGEVRLDAGQIQQTLINLLANAANAMEEAHTRHRSISVWVHLHDLKDTIELGVADSGPGVPLELRARIFEPGFTTRESGHGFGLSTVHRIVVNHRGSIAVGSSPEGGALFRVSLPCEATRVTAQAA
jgi:signal transduction histidine kinase